MYSVNISCYDKDSEQVIGGGGMYVHRFFWGKLLHLCSGYWVLRNVWMKEDWVPPCGGVWGEGHHGLCSAERGLAGVEWKLRD